MGNHPEKDPVVFEEEVRRIASSLWPQADGGAILAEGQERDGLYETDELVHCIECTTSRTKAKAEHDGEKLVKLAKTLRPRLRGRAYKGWFITSDDPTADQRAVIETLANRNSILLQAISFSSFRARLVDTKQYIECRRQHPFGSARNPSDDRYDKLNRYIDPTLVVRNGTGASSGAELRVSDLVSLAKSGQRVVLLGDYGAGKSMTMRECWSLLADEHLANRSNIVPVMLNLREHFGQQSAEEALERHARLIGFSSPSGLVRAWKAGYALVLLDGFDEIAVPGWTKRKMLSQARHDAMRLVREFSANSINGLMLSGRVHYFDSEVELRHSTEIHTRYDLIDIRDFTLRQSEQFIRDLSGASHRVPTWLPSRPLLLGYLLQRHALSDPNALATMNPAEGWDHLLNRICDREAKIEAGVDGGTLRHIVEQLASVARFDQDGIGPLTPSAIENAFRSVCGADPDERALILLQRLPGLSATREEDGTRTFVDQDFADAARAGDVARFIQNSHQAIRGTETWACTLQSLGIDVLLLLLEQAGWVEPHHISGALESAIRLGLSPALRLDLVLALVEAGGAPHPGTIVEDISIRQLDLADLGDGFEECVFSSCVINDLYFSENKEANTDLPGFRDCLFVRVHGRVSRDDMPNEFFDDNCVVENFVESVDNPSRIMELRMHPGKKVVLTMLRKLYLQRGSGRKESAFVRGLPQKEKRFVEPALAILQAHGLSARVKGGRRTLWVPIRSQHERVMAMLNAPATSKDDVLAEAAALV